MKEKEKWLKVFLLLKITQSQLRQWFSKTIQHKQVFFVKGIFWLHLDKQILFNNWNYKISITILTEVIK